ncbi:MAG TPA: AraC family transcriptional regulator [Gemmatimonadales bacterium]|nr:AraC family transcriptional regulator [Gemmatimonadales bacterium]
MEPASAPGTARYRLGDYRDYVPHPRLARVAEGVWTHRVSPNAALPSGAMHRVLPDPALSIAFRCRRDSTGAPVDAELLIIGPKTRPHVFRLLPGWETAAVRLKLEWVEPLFDLVPADHHDAEHVLGSVDPSACRLFDHLVETRTCGEAARALAAVVAHLAGTRSRAPAPLPAAAVDLVRRTHGGMSVDEVAHATGSSTRHLRRKVHRGAGISLKTYARVARLLRAVTAADQSALPAWARIAADCGYCDQSHLVRECRALTELTPCQVHRERWAEAETSNTG